MIENETMVYAFWSIEEVHIDQITVDEGTSNEWIRKVINDHSMIIQPKVRTDIELADFNLFRHAPCFFTKRSKSKFTVIIV
jgi:hypothetical protein